MAARLKGASRLALASTIAIGLVAVLATGVGASTAGTIKPPPWALHGPYSPKIDPANFVAGVDNPYFPLKPGTAFRYKGIKDGVPQTDDMVVTSLSKRIQGVKSTVVRDSVSQHGKVIERTFDWYAQDKEGNVWYMGELALELKHGKLVRASDSWQSGINGGKAGIIMRAHPRTGEVYRQEFFKPGGALDQARVSGLNGHVKVPAGTFKNVLVTVEWSPVEPQFETKYYVRGIGEVKEQVTLGGHESFELVRVSR